MFRTSHAPAPRRGPRLVVAMLLAGLAGLAQAAPDADGDGIPDAVEPTVGRYAYVKDNDVFANGRLFAMQQYRDFLRREGDTGGIDYWASQLDANTVTREQLIYTFLTGPEFTGRIAPVARLYFAYFRRVPDYGGLIYWIGRYGMDLSIYNISDVFAASAEFQATYGTKTNAEFVQLVYRNLFDRQPDPAGYNHWLNLLNTNQISRGVMMVSLSESAEHQAKSYTNVLITMAYAAMMQRAPDQGGFVYWQGVMSQGGNASTIIGGLYNTIEYKDRFMPYFSLAPTPHTVDAARFLSQATFGARGLGEIARTQAMGYEAWLNEQFAMPTANHVQYLREQQAVSTSQMVYDGNSYEAIWRHWLHGEDQLRARVAFALSQIFVISNIAPNLDPWAMSSYVDMLNRNAFGNYRKLLEDVTLHPAMGYYLNMQGNDKEDPARGRLPNENYGREVLQLFSIGLVQLNQDGTPVLGANGVALPAYDQDIVAGFAKVFTGWNYAGNATNSNSAFYNPKSDWINPMVAWPARHSTAAKQLLSGIVLPAGQTPEKDLKDALDNIFYHPNVGPFICKLLIQRLVTSNPAPAQIRRCALTFENNGLGERGHLAYVVRAILLDPEARDPSKVTGTGTGKQREPVIRFANLMRATNARSPSGNNTIHELDSPDDALGQSPLLAPSVFNFFSPGYRPPGPVAAAGLVAPEFQITTETSVVGVLNFFGNLIDRGYYGWDAPTKMTMNLDTLKTIAVYPTMLADHLNMLLCAGAMTANTRSTIINAVNAIPANNPTSRVKAALTLATFSPDFVIQK